MDWLEPLRQDTERIRQETKKIREETERIREETERIREENRKLKESIRKLKKINTQKLLQEITGSKMNQLTPEQIETLELAFSSYPENFPTTSKYASMRGIQQQLEELDGNPGYIFYISKAYTLNTDIPGEQLHCMMEKMKIGENV